MRPFYLEIGRATVKWNELHEELGVLFAIILNTEFRYRTVGLAIWHKLPSDRLQRELLREAVLARYGKKGVFENVKIRETVELLLKESEAISDIRNDLIHAPLRVRSSYIIKEDATFDHISTEVEPSDAYGHPRAKKMKTKMLSGRRLVDRYKLVTNTASELIKFCENIIASLQDAKKPWPAKPKLPNRGQNDLGKNRLSRQKSHASRRQSSPA